MLASRLTSRFRILVGFHYAADRLTCKWKRDEKGVALGPSLGAFGGLGVNSGESERRGSHREDDVLNRVDLSHFAACISLHKLTTSHNSTYRFCVT